MNEKKLKALNDEIRNFGMKIEDVNKKIDAVDEKLTDHLAAHYEFENRFSNIVEEMTQQRFDITQLKTDNSRIKDIQEKQRDLYDSHKKLVLSHEKIELKVDSMSDYIEGQKQREKDEREYRERRAEERKKERKENRRWSISQMIVVALFVVSSFGAGVSWVSIMLTSWKTAYENRYIQDRQENQKFLERIEKKLENKKP